MTPKTADLEASEKTVAAEICAALTAEIARGDIGEGEPLPTERELSERYSTSRPTVREALLMLSHRGYAELGGSRRPRARRPSVETVLEAATERLREVLGDRTAGAHLEQVRQFVECGAAGYAAREARQRQIAALQDALDACAATAGDAKAFIDADIAFHRTLVQIVDNDIILALHDLFVTTLVQGRAPVADRLAHDRMVTAEHRAIFDAIVARDVEGAMTTMERHLDRAFRARLTERTNQQ